MSVSVRARRMRALLAVTAIVVLAIPAAAPVFAAVSAHAAFDVYIGGCFNGHGPSSSSVSVYWRRAGGQLKASWTDTTDEQGAFRPPQAVCDAIRAESGDSIRAVFPNDALDRRMVIPSLTLNVDRKTSVVSGRSPANTTLQLYFSRRWIGGFGFPQFSCATTAAVDAAGAYSRSVANVSGGADCPAQYRARGGDDFTVVFTDSATGDTVSRYGYAPYVRVIIGSAVLSGATHAGESVTVHDQSSTGALRGTATGKGDLSGFFQGKLKKSGAAAVVRVGDRIDGNWAGTLAFAVPKVNITWDVGGNAVRGRCMANSPYGLTLAYGETLSNTSGTTDAQGNTQNMDGFSHTIAHGDVVTLVCARSSGDQIERQVTL